MIEKEKRKKRSFKYVICCLLVICLALLIWLLLRKKETIISNDVSDMEFGAIECISSNPNNPFFEPINAQSSKHTIKVLLAGKKLKEISYRYDGIFGSQEVAEGVRASMHANYNKYMENNGKYQEILNPVFLVNGNEVSISLYAEQKKIDKIIAKLLLVENDYSEFVNYDTEQFMKLYELKGFSCKSSN